MGEMHVEMMPTSNSRWDPDATGRFQAFGGRFVPETLMGAVIELGEVYAQAQKPVVTASGPRRGETGNGAKGGPQSAGGK